jgi:hypothetical protein
MAAPWVSVEIYLKCVLLLIFTYILNISNYFRVVFWCNIRNGDLYYIWVK